MSKKLTTEEFIEKGKITHGDRYDYSLVKYINNNTKITIVCSIHGEFKQSPRAHLSSGCIKCGLIKTHNSLKLSKDDFIKLANIKHNNKYNYLLVDYINSTTKIKIICPKHGVFEQTPNIHLTNHGCQKCGIESRRILTTKSINDFIKEANLVHLNKYDYSNVVYVNNSEKVSILCPIHGEFKQTPSKHLNSRGCGVCSDSKGELEIRKFLIVNKINFIRQHTFNDCRNIKLLPFDFYLPELNMCIEYQGEQHYKSIKWWGGDKTFNAVQKRDKIKYNYCSENNVKLLIIRYDENIQEILKQYC